MPELPEAETILRQLRCRILGSTISKVWIGRQDIIRKGHDLIPWFRSATIGEIDRRGKSIVLSCRKVRDEQKYLVAELGMTGLLLFRDAGQGYERHTHAILSFEGGQEPELRYWNPRRFGRLSCFDARGLDQFLRRRFGPDPLALSEQEFSDLVHAFRGRVKALLMNQRKIAGIGNIYANEILHHAGVHPHARGCQLRQQTLSRLHASTIAILREAIDQGGSTIRDFLAPDGTSGQYQHRHRVYQQAGRLCANGCQTLVKRLRSERSSFFCPTCQKRR